MAMCHTDLIDACCYEQQFPWRRAFQRAAIQFRHPNKIPCGALVVVDRDAGPLSGILFFCVNLLPETARIGLILRNWREIERMERLMLPNVEIGKWDESWVAESQKDWWVLSHASPHEPITKAFFSLSGRKLISAHWQYLFDHYPGPVIDLRVRGEEYREGRRKNPPASCEG